VKKKCNRAAARSFASGARVPGPASSARESTARESTRVGRARATHSRARDAMSARDELDATSDGFKQFVELQAKYAESASAMKSLRQRVQQREHDRARATLTTRELTALGDDDGARLFKPLGRSFVLEDKGALVEALEATSAAATEEIEKAMARREHLSKALSDAETNLRELMNGNEALAKELQARGVI